MNYTVQDYALKIKGHCGVNGISFVVWDGFGPLERMPFEALIASVLWRSCGRLSLQWSARLWSRVPAQMQRCGCGGLSAGPASEYSPSHPRSIPTPRSPSCPWPCPKGEDC